MKRTVTIFITLLCCCLCVVAQEFACRPLPTQKQIANTHVRVLLQDHFGLMWYAVDGTGLCCDDGYRVVTIAGDEQQPQLLKNAHITALAEDLRHNIWIGTDKGCYLFNRHNRSIQMMEATKGLTVTYLFTRSDGVMFVGANHILHQYKETDQPEFTYDLQNDNGLLTIASIAENESHAVMLALAGGGLYRLENEGGRLTTLDWPYSIDPTSVVADSQNKCWWIGTDGLGVVRFRQDYERLFSTVDDRDTDGNMGEVVHMSLDALRNTLWVTTRENLYAYQHEDDSLYAFDISAVDSAIRQRAPLTFTDKRGTCWLYGDSIDISLLSITGIAFTEPSNSPHVSFISADGIDYFAEQDDTLNISPDFNEVTLFVSSFDFLHTDKIQYAYRLSEDGDWITIPKGTNRINLTFEDSGNLTLQIRACNAQGKWSEPTSYLITRNQTEDSSGINVAAIIIILALLGVGAYAFYLYKKGKLTIPSLKAFIQKRKSQKKEKQTAKKKNVHATDKNVQTPAVTQPTASTRKTAVASPHAQKASEPVDDTTEVTSPRAMTDKEFAKLVAEAVRKHLGEPEFNVEELSGALMMSRINFYRRFERVMKEKPMEYIRNARLNLAAKLLSGTNMTIVEISIRVGFSTSRYFSKCFRDKFGMIPSEYRSAASKK